MTARVQCCIMDAARRETRVDGINELLVAATVCIGLALVVVFILVRERSAQRRVIEQAARLLAEQLGLRSERRFGAFHLRGVVEARPVDVRLSLGYFPQAEYEYGPDF